jgi:hypothetical protein
MNDVLEILGVSRMVTLNEQAAVRESESVAVQVTVVWPTGKPAPGWLVHVTATGWAPPTACGTVNTTGTGVLFGDVSVTEAGHDTVGAAGGVRGCVGGVLPQPTSTSNPRRGT